MRQHWLWVTRPEFYLDEHGDERADLEPGSQELGEGWWTCHPDTRAGDLVLLYRTAPKSDIAYLFEAASDARLLDDRPPGTITPTQQEELALAACREDPELARIRETMTALQQRFDELWAEGTKLSDELDRLIEEFPGILRVDLSELPDEPHRRRSSYEDREHAHYLKWKQAHNQELNFLGVDPPPENLDPESDEDSEILDEHLRNLAEARERMHTTFWSRVLERSDLPGDTMVWEGDEFSGSHVCEWKSRAKFGQPVRLAEVKAEPRLQEWSAVRGSFQRRVWAADEQWESLSRLIDRRNPGYRKLLDSFRDATVSKDIASERAVEDALVDSHMAPIDKNLELVGRQYRCAPHLWAIDLLCRDRTDQAYVVVELKVVKATEAVHSQTARYVGWVKEHLAAPGQPVRAIVVSDGYDDRFRYALAANDDFSHIDLRSLMHRLQADGFPGTTTR